MPRCQVLLVHAHTEPATCRWAAEQGRMSPAPRKSIDAGKAKQPWWHVRSRATLWLILCITGVWCCEHGANPGSTTGSRRCRGERRPAYGVATASRRAERPSSPLTTRTTARPTRGGPTRPAPGPLLLSVALQHARWDRHFRAAWESMPWLGCSHGEGLCRARSLYATGLICWMQTQVCGQAEANKHKMVTVHGLARNRRKGNVRTLGHLLPALAACTLPWRVLPWHQPAPHAT